MGRLNQKQLQIAEAAAKAAVEEYNRANSLSNRVTNLFKDLATKVTASSASAYSKVKENKSIIVFGFLAIATVIGLKKQADRKYKKAAEAAEAAEAASEASEASEAEEEARDAPPLDDNSSVLSRGTSTKAGTGGTYKARPPKHTTYLPSQGDAQSNDVPLDDLYTDVDNAKPASITGSVVGDGRGTASPTPGR